MFELLSGAAAMVLENADVLESPVAFQVLNALRRQQQKLANFGIAGVPQMPVMARIFDQHFVGSHGAHAIVDAVCAARSVALNVVESCGMHHGSLPAGHAGDELWGLV